MANVRTWIELDIKALHHNLKQFLNIIKPKTRLMAVIKSNAYGHGLVCTAQGLLKDTYFKKHGWFGVDSITEGLRLRREGIESPILILGHTLPKLFQEAKEKKLIISVADFASLSQLNKLKQKPQFFIKIDSGMHRRGFLPEDIDNLIYFLKNNKVIPAGIFTHFASASSNIHRASSLRQIRTFKNIINIFETSGFKNLIKSMSATGGTLFYPEAHFDMVRVGMGIYGYPPSLPDESKSVPSKIELRQPLVWKTVVAEIKEVPKGSYIGYSLSKKVVRQSRLAILPIGYWHGYDRRFSNKTEVLIKGQRVPVLGLVSMDMVVVDVTGIDTIEVGDEVVLIGRQGKGYIGADELAQKINCSHYELLTCLNPLIKRLEV